MQAVREGIKLAYAVWQDFRQAWPVLVTFELLFQLFKTWAVLPVVALLLVRLLFFSGRVAVSNHDLLNFLLSPTGILYASLFAIISVALVLLEQAGLMLLICLDAGRRQLTLRALLPQLARSCWRIAQLGAMKVFLLTLTLLPLVLLAGLTHLLLLTQHDIYYYLKDRPPAFWQAAGIGAILLTVALIAGLRLYLLWAFALPVLLYEDQLPSSALRISRERMQAAGWKTGGLLLLWLLLMLLLTALLTVAWRFLAGFLLAWSGETPALTVLMGLLMIHGLGLAIISFVTNVGQVLMVRRLYLMHHPENIPAASTAAPASDTDTDTRTLLRGLSYVAAYVIVLSVAGPVLVWAGIAQQLPDLPLVGVTAHRGHARRAPENTLAALQKAIDSGADYVEIDVHQTSDGVVVLLHDRDLQRVAGLSRRLDQMTYAEASTLDVGSWFAPEFAAERIPTLVDAIELCRDKIRMNIELKMFETGARLPAAVAEIIRQQAFAEECIVTSLDHAAILALKQQFPEIRTGLIVAHAIGPINRLNFDVLSVRQEFLSDAVLSDARRHGREVHVWTVNEPAQMTRQIKRGVDNLITSDPDLALQMRQQWADLTHSEQLLLATRMLLGLQP